MMNKVLILALTLTLMSASSYGAGKINPETEKPNVVIFYADDFGWGDIRRHNQNPDHFRYTPNMDRMFSEGIELANYMTHCVCSPSRAGLLTGMHYANVGAGPKVGGTLPNNISNIAKDFKKAGYKTGAFGKWHNSMPNFPEGGNGKRVKYSDAKYNKLHKQKSFDTENGIFETHKGWKWGEGVNAYGFDRWVGFYGGGGDFFDHYSNWHHDADWWIDRKYVPEERGYRTDLLTGHAIDFINASKDDPFFCYFPHEAVHSPVQLKRSDLKEFCEVIDRELGIKGQWEFVSNIVSPETGRKIGDVEKLRCAANEEFSLEKIDPDKKHYMPLVYAAFVYTMDKSIGKVIAEVEKLGEFNNTIFVFASDNGATPRGINLPFRGGKHSLWEGGVHVPAAVWWPGKLDSNTAPYSPDSNAYDGFISYIDLYPTIMSMSGQACFGVNLDGIDCWENLRENTECRPDDEDAIYWIWRRGGAVRTKDWKLHYYGDEKRCELFKIGTDVEESKNVAGQYPDKLKKFKDMYKGWIRDSKYSVAFLPVDSAILKSPNAAPEGEVLEVKAKQKRKLKNANSEAVFIRFADGQGWDQEYDAYIHAGDYIEFDIFVCEDSEVTKGCVYVPADGWNPFYDSKNGFNVDGIALTELDLPKGKWTRQVAGVGDISPLPLPINYITLRASEPGFYHYYIDNVVVRKNDGSIRSVIWDSKKHFAPLVYRYKNRNYNSLDGVKAQKGFPFSDILLTTVDLAK